MQIIDPFAATGEQAVNIVDPFETKPPVANGALGFNIIDPFEQKVTKPEPAPVAATPTPEPAPVAAAPAPTPEPAPVAAAPTPAPTPEPVVVPEKPKQSMFMAVPDKPDQYIPQAAKGVASGIIGLGSLWEGVNIGVDASALKIASKQLSNFDQIDAGTLKDPKQFLGKPSSQTWIDNAQYMNGDEATRAALREKYAGEIGQHRDVIQASLATLEKYKEFAKQHKGKVEDLTSVRGVRDFTDWLKFTMGSASVQLAPIILAAVATGGVGAGVIGLGMSAGEQFQQRIESVLNQKDAAYLSPEHQAQRVERYIQDTMGVSMAVAAANGLLDTIAGPVGAILRAKFAKEAAKATGKTLTAEAATAQAVKEIPRSFLEETLTGFSQEALSILGERYLGEQDYDWKDPKNLKRLINAMASEGVGGLLGAGFNVGAAARRLRSAPQKAQDEIDGLWKSLYDQVEGTGFTKEGVNAQVIDALDPNQKVAPRSVEDMAPPLEQAATPEQEAPPKQTAPDLNSPVVATTRTEVGGKESIKTTRADGSVDVDGVLVTPATKKETEEVKPLSDQEVIWLDQTATKQTEPPEEPAPEVVNYIDMETGEIIPSDQADPRVEYTNQETGEVIPPTRVEPTMGKTVTPEIEQQIKDEAARYAREYNLPLDLATDIVRGQHARGDLDDKRTSTESVTGRVEPSLSVSEQGTAAAQGAAPSDTTGLARPVEDTELPTTGEGAKLAPLAEIPTLTERPPAATYAQLAPEDRTAVLQEAQSLWESGEGLPMSKAWNSLPSWKRDMFAQELYANYDDLTTSGEAFNAAVKKVVEAKKPEEAKAAAPVEIVEPSKTQAEINKERQAAQKAAATPETNKIWQPLSNATSINNPFGVADINGVHYEFGQHGGQKYEVEVSTGKLGESGRVRDNGDKRSNIMYPGGPTLPYVPESVAPFLVKISQTKIGDIATRDALMAQIGEEFTKLVNTKTAGEKPAAPPAETPKTQAEINQERQAEQKVAAAKTKPATVSFEEARGKGIAYNESVLAGLRTIAEDDNIADDHPNRVGAVMLTGIDRQAGGAKGRASELLKGITDWADTNGKTIVLMPSGSIEGSRENLVSWYERNGFVQDNDGAMVRQPASAKTPAAKKPAGPKTPTMIQQREAFAKNLGAARQHRGSMRGRKNNELGKAVANGDIKGVIEALTQSKNKVIAEFAKRLLGTNVRPNIIIDNAAMETYDVPDRNSQQVTIDTSKTAVELLDIMRGLKSKVEALPDDDSRLGYDIVDTKVNIYSSVPSLGEDRETKLSSILYSDKTPIYSYIPKNKFKDNSKGKFLLYLDTLEKTVQDIGEEKLRRNATATTQSVGVSGAYNVETDEIAVPDYRANNEDVVAHELVHAQAIDAIANPAPHQREAVKRLDTLFKHVQDHLANNQKALFPYYIKDEEYGLTSIQEFAAEGISNPAFQFLLSIIPYENTSAWGKFTKTIADLLGIKNVNAFTEFLNLYDQITQPAPVEETPAAETPAAEKKPAAVEETVPTDQEMKDAGFTSHEIDQLKRKPWPERYRQIKEGYKYIAGEFRQITQADVDIVKESNQRKQVLKAEAKEKLDKAFAADPSAHVSHILGSDWGSGNSPKEYQNAAYAFLDIKYGFPDSNVAILESRLAAANKANGVKETPAAKTPEVKAKKPTAKERKAQAEQKMFDLLGAKVGDTITFSQDIGYITANKPLVISSISNAGEMSVTDPSRGSSTSEKLSQIQAQAGRGLTWEVTPAEKPAAKPKGRRKVERTAEGQAKYEADRLAAQAPLIKAIRDVDKLIAFLSKSIDPNKIGERRDAIYQLHQFATSRAFKAKKASGKKAKSFLAQSNKITQKERDDLARRLDNEKAQEPKPLAAYAQTASEPVKAFYKFTRATQAINHIMRNGTPFERALAVRLKPFLEDVRLIVADADAHPDIIKILNGTDKGTSASGAYSSRIFGNDVRSMIVLRGENFAGKPGQQGVNNVIFLHEALHAATEAKIAQYRKLIAEGKPVPLKLEEMMLELQRTMDVAKAEYEKLKASGKPISPSLRHAFEKVGIANFPEEFVAYGMTNSDVQEFLLKAPGELRQDRAIGFWKSLFSRFVNTMRAAFDMDSKHQSALQDLMLITEGIMQLQEVAPASTAGVQLAAKNLKAKTTKADKDIEKVQRSHDLSGGVKLFKDAGDLRTFKNYETLIKTGWDSMAVGVKLSILGALPTSSIIDWKGGQVPALIRIDELVQRAAGLRQNLLAGYARKADALGRFVAEHGDYGTGKLATAMHLARLSSVTPSVFIDRADALTNDPRIANFSKLLADPRTNQNELAAIKDKLNERIASVNATFDAYDALKPIKGAQDMYKMVRQFYRDGQALTRTLLDQNIDKLQLQGDINDPSTPKGKLMLSVRRMYEDSEFKGVEEYFPFMRHGDHRLDVAGPDGKETYFFDTTRERSKAIAKRAEQLKVSPEDGNIFKKSNESYKDSRNIAAKESRMLTEMFRIIEDAAAKPGVNKDDLKDQLYQVYLSTLPEASYRKQFMHAENVTGFTSDIFRNFQTSATRIANQATKLRYGQDVEAEIQAAKDSTEGMPPNMQEELEGFINEVAVRAREEFDPRPQSRVANGLTQFAYYWLLSGAASAAIQTTSLPIFVMSHLNPEYGYGKSAAKLARWMNVYKSMSFTTDTYEGEKTLTAPTVRESSLFDNNPILQQAFDEALARNVTTQLSGTPYSDSNRTPTNARNSLPRVALRETANLMSGLFTGAERLTREITFMMTFELEYEKSGDFDKAVQKAVDMVHNQLGRFDTFDKPRLLRNGIGKVALQFKPYAGVVTKVFVKGLLTAIKPGQRAQGLQILSGILLMGAMLHGVTGMPLYTVICDVIDSVLDELEDDEKRKRKIARYREVFGKDSISDDWGIEYVKDKEARIARDPLTATNSDMRFRYEFLPSFTGKLSYTTSSGRKIDLAQMIEKGPVSVATDMNIGSRTSFNDIWFKDPREGKDFEEQVKNTVEAFTPPSISAAFNVVKGVSGMVKGETRKGIEQASPAAVANPLKAERISREGVTNRDNELILGKSELSATNIFAQATGLASTRAAALEEQKYKYTGENAKAEKRKQVILEELKKAYLNESVPLKEQDEAQRKVNNQIDQHNRRYPVPGLLIDGDTIGDTLEKAFEARGMSSRGMHINDVRTPNLRALRERLVPGQPR